MPNAGRAVCGQVMTMTPSQRINDDARPAPVSDVHDRVNDLVGQGAVMTICNSPCAPYLVGALRWLDYDQSLAIFAANGDRASDAHVVRFDRVVEKDRAVHFFTGEQHVAALVTIADADVDDPDDYKVGWEIWQHVAPMKRDFVSDVLSRLEDSRVAPFIPAAGHPRNA